MYGGPKMKNAILVFAAISLVSVCGTLIGGMIQLPGYCDPQYLIILEVLIGIYVSLTIIVSLLVIIATVRDMKYISIGVLALFFSGLITGILYLVWKTHAENEYDGSFYKTNKNDALSEEEYSKQIDILDEMKLRGAIKNEEYIERKEKLLKKRKSA